MIYIKPHIKHYKIKPPYNLPFYIKPNEHPGVTGNLCFWWARVRKYDTAEVHNPSRHHPKTHQWSSVQTAQIQVQEQTETNSCAKGQVKTDATLLCPIALALVLAWHRPVQFKLSVDIYSPLTWTPHNFVTQIFIRWENAHLCIQSSRNWFAHICISWARCYGKIQTKKTQEMLSVRSQ